MSSRQNVHCHGGILMMAHSRSALLMVRPRSCPIRVSDDRKIFTLSCRWLGKSSPRKILRDLRRVRAHMKSHRCETGVKLDRVHDDAVVAHQDALKNVQSNNHVHQECKPIPPYVDWIGLSRLWPSADDEGRVESLSVSSVFSGIGTELVVVELLRRFPPAFGFSDFTHTCAFDCDQPCREVLTGMHPGCVFGDLLSLVPDHRLRRMKHIATEHTFERLYRYVLGKSWKLHAHAFCFSMHCERSVQLGDISICGMPCVDYSNTGKRQGLSGCSGLLVLVWCKLVLQHLPRVLIIENVIGFLKAGYSVVKRALCCRYTFEVIVMDLRVVACPCSRPRLYVVATLKDTCTLAQPLRVLHQCFPLRPWAGTGGDYFYMSLPETKLTMTQKMHLQAYMDLYPLIPRVHDLSQNPRIRPRHLLSAKELGVLTRSALFYSTRCSRLMHGVESLVAQGVASLCFVPAFPGWMAFCICSSFVRFL